MAGTGPISGSVASRSDLRPASIAGLKCAIGKSRAVMEPVQARLGATGGRSRSVAKRSAAKKNGRLGGRPKKKVRAA